MEKNKIQQLFTEMEDLFVSTQELFDKTSVVLENELYSDEDGKILAEALKISFYEQGDKMPKYLVNRTCAILMGKLEDKKIEYWYNELIKE